MIDTLVRILPIKTAALAAKLAGVAGFTGAGAFAFAAYANGQRSCEIELKRIAGQIAALYADDRFLAEISLNNGSARKAFASKDGAEIPVLRPGVRIEVRQNGVAILQGVLAA